MMIVAMTTIRCRVFDSDFIHERNSKKDLKIKIRS